jgi:hypothetical protein
MHRYYFINTHSEDRISQEDIDLTKKENCRKLHNEEEHDLYPSPNTVRMIK